MLRLKLMKLQPMTVHLPLLESLLPSIGKLQSRPSSSGILERVVINKIMDWVNHEGNLPPMEVRRLLTQMACVLRGA
jgi:hypothetical protein